MKIEKGQCYCCGEWVWQTCPHCANFVPTKKLRQGLIKATEFAGGLTKVLVALCNICENTLTKTGMKSVISNLQEGGEALLIDKEKDLEYTQWKDEFGEPGFWEKTKL